MDFCSARNWTQSLTYDSYVLYHWAKSPVPIVLYYQNNSNSKSCHLYNLKVVVIINWESIICDTIKYHSLKVEKIIILKHRSGKLVMLKIHNTMPGI